MAQWLNYVQTVLAASTYKGYAKVAKRFARTVAKPLAQLTARDVIDYLQGHLQRGVSRRTANTWLITIRSFLRWAKDQSLVDAELLDQLPTNITYRPSRPVAATEKEVEAILQQGGLPSPYRLAVLLMFDLGLRVSEAAQLRWSNVDLTEGSITVIGKGNKLRQLPISSRRLHEALVSAQQEDSADDCPVVWIDHAGKPRNEPLTPTSIRDRLHQACQQAALSRQLTPHCLRHGFATRAARAGVHARFIQRPWATAHWMSLRAIWIALPPTSTTCASNWRSYEAVSLTGDSPPANI